MFEDIIVKKKHKITESDLPSCDTCYWAREKNAGVICHLYYPPTLKETTIEHCKWWRKDKVRKK